MYMYLAKTKNLHQIVIPIPYQCNQPADKSTQPVYNLQERQNCSRDCKQMARLKRF